MTTEQTGPGSAGDTWHGEWQGASAGANVSVIVTRVEEFGDGPALHRHPYAETIIVRAGRATITIGPDTVTASPGEVLVVPASTPHSFVNSGPGVLETIDVHEHGTFITEWL